MSASAGRVMPLPKGDWNSATQYKLLDIVYYNGASYIAKGTSTGATPPNATYWQFLCSGSVANLADIGDVTITNPANGDVLRYNSVSGKWENDGSLGLSVVNGAINITYNV